VARSGGSGGPSKGRIRKLFCCFGDLKSRWGERKRVVPNLVLGERFLKDDPDSNEGFEKEGGGDVGK